MIPGKIRRFYKSVSTAAAAEGGFSVMLDGKPVRTPAKAPLAVPTPALAQALQTEWEAQGEQLEPTSMPLTQLASTAIDRVAPLREGVVEELLNYASTDLLCYRADDPEELIARQNAVWQPLVDWALTRFDARLAVARGVMPVEQPPEALTALRRAVEAYDQWRLTALQMATAATGSLVLALALMEGRLDASGAFAASQLDELFQAELWGEDWEAVERRDRLLADVTAAARFKDLVAQ
jgi:chaperone required for assembly of F1-ATPase